MLRGTRVQIDLQQLKANTRLLKSWNGSGHFFCPMVKANAYGHGDVAVARALVDVGVSAIGVALIEEALHLREAGLVRTPIMTYGPFHTAGASAMLTHDLTPVVGRFADLEALRAVTGNRALPIHLKFNTGMNRLGFDAAVDLEPLRRALAAAPHLRVVGLCSHLTHGDDILRDDGPTALQLKKLNALRPYFPGAMVHVHKSASLATLARAGRPKTDDLGARPGISIYGIPHDGNLTGPGLAPVLRWVTNLLVTHDVEAGAAVSYGARWVATRPSRIGVIPVGYGDGYSRVLSNRGEVLMRGRRVPVVGTVCMDYTLVDLTEICRDEPPRIGEEVVLLGRQGLEEITAVDLATRMDTIAYEVVTAIGPRVDRELL